MLIFSLLEFTCLTFERPAKLWRITLLCDAQSYSLMFSCSHPWYLLSFVSFRVYYGDCNKSILSICRLVSCPGIVAIQRPQPSVLKLVHNPVSIWVKTSWAGCWARPLYNQNPANGHITPQYMCAPWCGATCWCPVGVHSLVSHWLVSILNNMHGVSPPMSTPPTTAVPAFHLTPPTTHISFPSRAPLQHPPFLLPFRNPIYFVWNFLSSHGDFSHPLTQPPSPPSPSPSSLTTITHHTPPSLTLSPPAPQRRPPHSYPQLPRDTWVSLQNCEMLLDPNNTQLKPNVSQFKSHRILCSFPLCFLTCQADSTKMSRFFIWKVCVMHHVLFPGNDLIWCSTVCTRIQDTSFFISQSWLQRNKYM